MSYRPARRLTVATLALAVVGFAPSAGGSVRSPRLVAATTTRLAPVAEAVRASAPPTTAAPVDVPPAAHVFASGNAQLDAFLPTMPIVLFEGGAHVHFGYNPIDCCHAGGYNPGPNDVWVSVRALANPSILAYVTAHELGHSVNLHSSRGPALTAAVAGAPVVRPGSPWDASEKVADCVAWVLYPAQTSASGIKYWNCPDPWRSQVRAALLR